MSPIYWPGTGIPKSQRNAFTAHLQDPRSSIRFKEKTGKKPTTAVGKFAVYARAPSGRTA